MTNPTETSGRPPLPCGDGCGQMVPQPATGRPRRYLNEDHRRNAYRKGPVQPTALTTALVEALRTQPGDPEPLGELTEAIADAIASLTMLRALWRSSSGTALESELAAARRRVEDLQSEVDEAHRSAQRAAEDTRLAVRAASESRAEIQETLDETAGALEVAELKIEAQVEELNQSAESLRDALAQLDDQRRAQESAQQRIAELEETLRDARARADELARTAARVTDLDRLVEQLRQEATTVRDELADARGAAAAATARAAEADAARRVGETQSAGQTDRIRQLEERLLEVQTESRNRLDQEHRAAAERLDEERRIANERLDDLRGERDRLTAQVANLTAHLNRPPAAS